MVSLDFSSTLKQPLEGCRIGVTGTDSFTDRLKKQIKSFGGTSECILSLLIESCRKGGKMKEAYEKLPFYTWIVFTSANGVREFFHGLLEWGYDFRAVGHVKFAVVGRGTADELLRHGFSADYIPEKYQVQDLAAGLKGLISREDRLLIPRSSGGSKELNEILDEAGAFYDDIVLYDVASAGLDTENRAEALKQLDYLTFSSASGVEAFFRESDEEIKEALAGLKMVCIGDITAKALWSMGGRRISSPGFTASRG